MFDEELLKKVEALNFRHPPAQKRIVCDDPEIWVEEHGWDRENGNLQFVLVVNGMRIGFYEPYSEAVRLREREKYGSAGKYVRGKLVVTGRPTWVIGHVGDMLFHWDVAAGRRVDDTNRTKFRSRAEQDLALCVIKAALSKHLQGFPKADVHPPCARVVFTDELQQSLDDGSLIAGA